MEPSSKNSLVMLLLLLFVSCTVPTEDPFVSIGIPEKIKQVVVVTTPTWASLTGELQMFEKSDGRWSAGDSKIPVTIGRNGLAWGKGLHEEIVDAVVKIEGDGKSPAGIFSLGSAFGYDSTPPDGLKLPYKQATDRDYFIDDPESEDYNQWVTLPDDVANDPKGMWYSFERMKRDDELYELGIVVNHNSDPAVKGKGSAIFIHIWRGPQSPTAGCTAMSKENMLTLMRWLDPKKYPILLAVPSDKMAAVKIQGD